MWYEVWIGRIYLSFVHQHIIRRAVTVDSGGQYNPEDCEPKETSHHVRSSKVREFFFWGGEGVGVVAQIVSTSECLYHFINTIQKIPTCTTHRRICNNVLKLLFLKVLGLMLFLSYVVYIYIDSWPRINCPLTRSDSSCVTNKHFALFCSSPFQMCISIIF